MLQRILTLQKRVIFRYCGPRHCGWCEYSREGVISIDLTKRNNPGRVYVHEAIHALHPDWAETRILYWERKIWNSLTARQKFLVYRKLFHRQFRDREEAE